MDSNKVIHIHGFLKEVAFCSALAESGGVSLPSSLQPLLNVDWGLALALKALVPEPCPNFSFHGPRDHIRSRSRFTTPFRLACL